MKSRLFIICSVLVAFFLSSSCMKSDKSGILGIEVPVGNGTVSAETPYIITGIVESSPAHTAGLMPGDEIVQINQTEIRKGMNFDNIYNTLLKGKPGTKLTLYVKRNGEALVFDVVMAERAE